MAQAFPYHASLLHGDLNEAEERDRHTAGEDVAYASLNRGLFILPAEPNAAFPDPAGRSSAEASLPASHIDRIEDAWKQSPIAYQSDPRYLTPQVPLTREEVQRTEREVDEPGQTNEVMMRHGNGNCKPCILNYYGSCNRGSECMYCHMTHSRRQCKRLRLSKPTRARVGDLRNHVRASGQMSNMVAAPSHDA